MNAVPKVNPEAIRMKTAQAAPKAAFSDFLMGAADVSQAMYAGAQELGSQWTGGSNMAAAVLNAAFSGISAAGGVASASAGAGAAGMGSPYAQMPGMMGSPRFTTAGGTVGGKFANVGTDAGGVAGTGIQQQELIGTMNANNLKLLELQALMQSNMQSWTTKSNILSADHRARMSMIEKFTARG